MPRTAQRRRLDRGIYRFGTAGTYEIRATVGGVTYYATAPADATLKELRATRARLSSTGHTETPRAERGTLAADVKRYLRLIGHLATADDRADHLNAWIAILGDTPRHRLTRADVLRARTIWLSEGRTDHDPKELRIKRGPLAARTINHYCDTLRHLFHVLDGRRASTPVDEVPHLSVPRTPIQRVPETLMLAIDAKLQQAEHRGVRDAKVRARFRVLITSGKRPIEVARATPADVDFSARVWVPRDAKGGYTPGLYLNDEQLAAWQLFAESGAWGEFNRGAFVRALRAAGWPIGLRFYQARHSTWIAASERGADLADIAAGAGHRDMALTRRMYVPVLNARMQALSERLENRFQGFPVVPVSGPGRK